jgi:hypothetical protein
MEMERQVALFDNHRKKFIYIIENKVIYHKDSPEFIWNIVKDENTNLYIIKDSQLRNINTNLSLERYNILLFTKNHNKLINSEFDFEIVTYTPSLGICNWSSLYKFTYKNLLEEGAIVINNNFKCFNTIKIYLGKRSQMIYGFEEDVSGKSLLEIAKLPHYEKIFSSPNFSTVIIFCHSTHHKKSNYWNTIFTDEDRKREIDEFNKLSMHLRRFLSKIFILQNWESDNYRHKSKDATQRMIEWVTARQEGVDIFRKSNVYIKYDMVQPFCDNVFHGFEINRVKDNNSCIYEVVPHIRVDLISYSCYETQQNKDEFEYAINIILSKINRNRKYTKGGVPPCLDIFQSPLYIGEFGLSNSHYQDSVVIHTLNNIYEIASKYHFPYINFWNLYNNEENRDFGLINKDGQFTLSGKLFNSLKIK